MRHVTQPNFVDVRNEIDESGDANSEDEVKGIRLDDIEEERMNNENEGYVLVEVERRSEGIRVDVNGKSTGFKSRANKSSMNSISPSKLRLLAPASVLASSSKRNNYVDEDGEYLSDELGSSDPDNSDNERLPKYEKFRKRVVEQRL